MMTQTYTSLVEFPNVVLKNSKKSSVFGLQAFGRNQTGILTLNNDPLFNELENSITPFNRSTALFNIHNPKPEPCARSVAR